MVRGIASEMCAVGGTSSGGHVATIDASFVQVQRGFFDARMCNHRMNQVLNSELFPRDLFVVLSSQHSTQSGVGPSSQHSAFGGSCESVTLGVAPPPSQPSALPLSQPSAQPSGKPRSQRRALSRVSSLLFVPAASRGMSLQHCPRHNWVSGRAVVPMRAVCWSGNHTAVEHCLWVFAWDWICAFAQRFTPLVGQHTRVVSSLRTYQRLVGRARNCALSLEGTVLCRSGGPSQRGALSADLCRW